MGNPDSRQNDVLSVVATRFCVLESSCTHRVYAHWVNCQQLFLPLRATIPTIATGKVMLTPVRLRTTILPRDILSFALPPQRQLLQYTATLLRGARVIHVNATSKGGGVAELLRSLIPHLRALGIRAQWYVIDPSVGADFFAVTNLIHNSLQGQQVRLTRGQWERYFSVSKKLAGALAQLRGDLFVINDPQPLAAGALSVAPQAIYYSHIDTSSPQPSSWKKFLPFILKYRAAVFSNASFVNHAIPRSKIAVFPPAIDPHALKQQTVPRATARRYLSKFGIPEEGPLIVQVSRFDIWKNPLGVIAAFQKVRQKFPQAHLALVGFHTADDNPAATAVYRAVKKSAGRDPHIHLFFHPRRIRVPFFTMMAQNAADVVVQNSTREGFGLTVAEAMWKRKPVIGGPASGIRLQIQHGTSGFIAPSTARLASLLALLLSNPRERRRIGSNARARVREQFLFPRLLADHLSLYATLLTGKK
ncbi:glycosyltransferase [Candidatus Parcubacteria bacterium]|nr:MAG: glycosyltransferase [Candidatus Parcubacteria bacterium]